MFYLRLLILVCLILPAVVFIAACDDDDDDDQVIDDDAVDDDAVDDDTTDDDVIDDDVADDDQADDDAEPFYVGVDANEIPTMEGWGKLWLEQGVSRDPVELFAQKGVNALRLRLWVGEDGPYTPEYALDLGRRADQAGLRIMPVIFLADDWAAVDKQPRPQIWAGLSHAELLAEIETYCRDLTALLVAEDFTIPYYEIGNEIDFGLCGVFATPAQQGDLDALVAEIWPAQAEIIAACQQGVLVSDPGARFMLHIMNWFDAEFIERFFGFMIDAALPLDVLGFSFYPTLEGTSSQQAFFDNQSVIAALNRPAVVAESGYPADPDLGLLFTFLNHPVDGYPFTPAGQAAWLADHLDWATAETNLVGSFYFAPEYYFTPFGNIWDAFALFDAQGEARPALNGL